jgi:hypothetical protein
MQRIHEEESKMLQVRESLQIREAVDGDAVRIESLQLRDEYEPPCMRCEASYIPGTRRKGSLIGVVDATVRVALAIPGLSTSTC